MNQMMAIRCVRTEPPPLFTSPTVAFSIERSSGVAFFSTTSSTAAGGATKVLISGCDEGSFVLEVPGAGADAGFSMSMKVVRPFLPTS